MEQNRLEALTYHKDPAHKDCEHEGDASILPPSIYSHSAFPSVTRKEVTSSLTQASLLLELKVSAPLYQGLLPGKDPLSCIINFPFLRDGSN